MQNDLHPAFYMFCFSCKDENNRNDNKTRRDPAAYLRFVPLSLPWDLSLVAVQQSFQSLSSNRDQHKNLNGGDAAKSRDAMAKEVYRRLFGWIVDKVCYVHKMACSVEDKV